MKATVHALTVAVATAALAAPAAAQGPRAELSIPFKAAAPATATGLDMDLRYLNPQNRDEKPPTIQKLAIHLPPGTVIDPTAVPVCSASDEQIQARGRDACPRETQVGTGKLDVYLGSPDDPHTTDVALFNGPGQIVEVLFFEGTNTTAAIERLPIEGSTISGRPVQVPPGAPPEQRFSASRIVWDIPARGGYLVTPPTCGGAWTTVGEFEFADGGSTRVESTQACQRPPAGDLAPARSVRVAVAPVRVVRGRPTRLRIQVLSDDPACVRGATVRVGRRAARTGADGRATLRAVVRWRRPAAQVRAATPCGAARATLRIRRR